MVRFGIVGCGTISSIFVQAIARVDRAELTGVFDINDAHGREFAKQCGAAYYPTMEHLLASDIDAVYISTPSGMHAENAIQAANAGKHIVIEKPMCISSEQLDAISEACEKNHVTLSAISQLFFSDAFQEVKKAVDEGRLGRVFLADLTMKYYRSDEYYRAGGWRGTWSFDGGGALMNQGIHGVSLLLNLLGPVRSVRALTRAFVHPIEVEDTAIAMVEFRSGAIGSIIATTSVQPGEPRLMHIHGTKGTITLTEATITQWDVEGEESVKPDVQHIQSSAFLPTDLSYELHRRQVEDFIDALENGTKPKLSIAEGRMPVELILAIYRSSQTGEPVFFE